MLDQLDAGMFSSQDSIELYKFIAFLIGQKQEEQKQPSPLLLAAPCPISISKR